MFNFRLMKIQHLFFFLIFGFLSCDKTKVTVDIPEKNYEGVWIVRSVTGKVKDDPALVSMDKFYKGRWIKYNNDSSYTTNINGQYDYGKYKVKVDDPKVVFLNSFRGDTYNINAVYDNAGRGTINHRISIPEMTGTQEYEILCTVKDFNYGDPAYDTYSAENNYWRLPAESSENDSLLTKRLINHIDFWIAYLNTADKLELSSFEYSNLNTCFIFSNYGVQALKYEKWENSFKSLFYTREEAERAFKLLSKAFYKCTFEKNENAYTQGINLFTQIKYQLNQAIKSGE